MPTPTALEIRGLRKRFGHLSVLDGLALDIGRNEVVALIGENGAGKSTLVRCIARAVTADQGEVRVCGRPLGATAADVQQQGVSVVWQDLALCDNLDAAANIFLGREPTGPGGMVLGDTEMYAEAARLLAEIGVEVPDLGAPVGTLSGGQRQSVALARALVDRPKLLILDEPTASLDRQSQAAVERLIGDSRVAGSAVLLISHDLELVCRLADRVTVMRGGRIVAETPAVEVHPDDLAALMSGIEADSTARRQLHRLHSLVDQLSGVQPSRTLPLIVTAMAVAIDQERLCVHLVPGLAARHDEPTVLRRTAAIGLPADLLNATDTVPIGQEGGMIGLAADTGHTVIVDDVRSEAHHDEQLAIAGANGIRSAWATPILGSGGVLGTISGFGDGPGGPTGDQLELVSLYASHAAAAIEREWLLEEVTQRIQILEGLGGMLAVLAGPEASSSELGPALTALGRGLAAEHVALFASGHEMLARSDPDSATGRSLPGAAVDAAAAILAGERDPVVRRLGPTVDPDHGTSSDVSTVAAVRIEGPDRSKALVACWRGDGTTDGRIETLRDAANSLRLALERAALDDARAEAAALRRSEALQRQFLSRLSHDLRTPLTAIHGYADTLRQTDVTWDEATTDRFLATIVSESARLGRLVSDLLDASALESGVLGLDRDWLDLEPVVDASIACVPVEPPTTVEVVVAPETPAVHADHDRIQQVLVNLVENAVRHTPMGTRITVDVRPGPADTADIRVIDDGCGLPPGFDQGDFGPAGRHGGTAGGLGLGLGIARGIVEGHGGTLRLTSTRSGTTVRVRLPVQPPGQHTGARA